jgi:hypothetical protein
MKTIHKYPVEFAEADRPDRPLFDMPKGAEPLCIQMQFGTPCVWAIVDTEQEQEIRGFYIVGTGHEIPERAGRYVGTFQLGGGQYVFHLFEEEI